MTRTVAINLLSGLLPLAVLLCIPESSGFIPLAFCWIVVQVACWGCALPLLRWNRDLLGLAMHALLPSLLSWGIALAVQTSLDDVVRYYALNFLLEFSLAGIAVLLLRFDKALVNVHENRLVIKQNPRPQFQLTWLFSVSVFAALVAALFGYLQKTEENLWKLAMGFLQVGSWFWIAESLLQPKLRWKSASFLVLAMGTFWFWTLSAPSLGNAILWSIWLHGQSLVLVIPLLYRWAGWRIVPRELAEHLLSYPVVKETPGAEFDEAHD
jgi:hypothetical protein